jgi:DNA-binding NarL/FixJ family response regulator
MNHLDELIEQHGDIRTILVAGAPTEYPENLVQHLTDAGMTVIGPVDTARLALALAAQSAADLALVTPKLAGQRDGAELARRLKDTWGVPTVVLQRA